MKDITSTTTFGKVLEFAEPVLGNWIETIIKYPYATYEDCPYYYSERMNAGLLGYAALMSKVFYPLEEHPVTRRKIMLADKGKRGERVDLWLVNVNDAGKDLILEAKIAWNKKGIGESITKAVRQVKSITKTSPLDTIKCGAIFCVHGFGEDEKDHLEDNIESLIKGIDLSLRDTLGKGHSYLVAHCYPQAARSIKGTGVYRNTIYPGVTLVITTTN